MKTFYIALHTAFEKAQNLQKFTAVDLPYIKIIDLYAGQDFDATNFDVHPTPALYFSWSIDYKTEPATATLNFRIAYEQLRDTSNLSLSKDKALKFFEMADVVDKIIKEIKTQHTGAPHLIFEGQELEPTVVDVYLLTYECPYYGNQKTQQCQILPGRIDDLELKKELFKKVL